MTVECCCIVKSIALDHQSLERSQITDEGDLRCLAANASVFWLYMCGRQREIKKDKVVVCVREERGTEGKNKK